MLNRFNLLLLLASTAILPGCVGSKFVVDDAENEANFPDLHQVPERPDIQESTRKGLSKEEITQTHEKDLSDNEALRKKHGL